MRNIGNHLTAKLAVLILCLILPVNIIAIQFVVNMQHEMEKQISLSTMNVINVYTGFLDTEMEKADDYLYEILNNDKDGIELLNQTKTLEAQNAWVWTAQKLQKNLPDGNGVNGYFIYRPEMDDLLFACSNGNMEAKQIFRDSLLDNIRQEKIKKKWSLLEVWERQYAARVNQLKGVYFGSFIDLEEIRNNVAGDMTYDNAEVSFSQEKEKTTDKNQIVVSSDTKRGDFDLTVTVKNVSIMNSLSLSRVIQFLMVGICLLAIPVLYIVLKKWVMIPVGELNKAHLELEKGNREYRITDQADSYEMQSAFDSFNQMADNIHDLRIENMEKELEKQNLELQNLQLQIRPHFLLNTFNLIYNLASRGEAESVQNVILYLSDYFRYLFRSGRNLELFSKELELIKKYMESVQIRYPDRIDIYYEIDPDVLMVRVPPLLIHNFVENVIQHGIPDDRSVVIILSAEYMDGEVHIEISDNGMGMEEEKVRKINAGQFEEKKGKNVGLKNSVKRLKYFYGEQASLHVESEEGEGTTMTIIFPYNLEGGEEVE